MDRGRAPVFERRKHTEGGHRRNGTQIVADYGDISDEVMVRLPDRVDDAVSENSRPEFSEEGVMPIIHLLFINRFTTNMSGMRPAL